MATRMAYPIAHHFPGTVIWESWFDLTTHVCTTRPESSSAGIPVAVVFPGGSSLYYKADESGITKGYPTGLPVDLSAGEQINPTGSPLILGRFRPVLGASPVQRVIGFELEPGQQLAN